MIRVGDLLVAVVIISGNFLLGCEAIFTTYINAATAVVSQSAVILQPKTMLYLLIYIILLYKV